MSNLSKDTEIASKTVSDIEVLKSSCENRIEVLDPKLCDWFESEIVKNSNVSKNHTNDRLSNLEEFRAKVREYRNRKNRTMKTLNIKSSIQQRPVEAKKPTPKPVSTHTLVASAAKVPETKPVSKAFQSDIRQRLAMLRQKTAMNK